MGLSIEPYVEPYVEPFVETSEIFLHESMSSRDMFGILIQSIWEQEFGWIYLHIGLHIGPFKGPY